MNRQPRFACGVEPNAPICTSRPEAPATTRDGHGVNFVACGLGTATADETGKVGVAIWVVAGSETRTAEEATRSGDARPSGGGATWTSGTLER